MSIIDVVKRKLKEREERKDRESEERLERTRQERITLEKRAGIERSRQAEEKRIARAKKTIASGNTGGVAGFLQGIGKSMSAPKRRGKRSTRGLENGFDAIGSGGSFEPPRFEDPFAPRGRKGKKGMPKFKEIRFD